MGAVGKIINGKYVQFANDKKGGAVTIPNLEPEKVLVSSSSGTVTASEISTDKLEMLINVTSDIQKQIDDLSDRIGEEGGLGGVPLGDCENITIENKINSLLLNWKEPENIVFDGATTAEWAGTKVVRKEGEYSKNINDGVLVIDNTAKNAYVENPLIDGDLKDGIEYFYTLFPYTSKNVYTMSDRNRISGFNSSVSEVLADNSWDVIAKVSEEGQAGDYWKIGDVKDGFRIIGLNHDELPGLVTEHVKVGITFFVDESYVNNGGTIPASKWANANSWYYYNSNNVLPYRYLLNNEDLLVSEEISRHIKQIRKPYVLTNSGSQVANMNCRLFLLSTSELGVNVHSAIKEGEPYEEISNCRAFNSTYWTRTPSTVNNGGGAYAIAANGNRIAGAWNSNYSLRFGFCI